VSQKAKRAVETKLNGAFQKSDLKAELEDIRSKIMRQSQRAQTVHQKIETIIASKVKKERVGAKRLEA